MHNPGTRDRQPCKQTLARGETAEKGKYPDGADVEEPGTATSSFATEMSSSTVRSMNTFEEEVAALEVELEAEGFPRFKAIGPIYDRVEQ